MSDEEEQINPKNHKQLLQAISSLGKTQHIRKSTRDEPKLQQDEFQLVKGAAVVSKEKAQPVGINDVVQVLRGTKKHLDAGKQLKAVATTKKVLQKPLEKPAAERIKRTIGYENVKKKLEKWDAVVATNRTAETQVFPLKSETVYVNTSLHRKPLEQSVKSDLMLQMEELETKYAKLKREHMGDMQDPAELEKREQQLLNKKLTKEELISRRKELAYLKMRESQKSAKARLQNKIKSKKYHKLMKKQKLQEQIKQFELLQKTNPEAALEKLNQLEKSRVLERANLRHKNTGTWAKNLQVRAKYDKDVRKDLAEQLQISRQLTQKTKENESDEEGDDKQNKSIEQDEEMDYDPFNPWTTVGKNGKEPNNEQEEQKNWRKYWLERNDKEKKLEEYKRLLNDKTTEEKESDMETEDKETKGKKEVQKVQDTSEPTSKRKFLKKTKSIVMHSEKIKLKISKKPKMENGWLVEEIVPVSSKSIDDIFDVQEDKIREKLQKKLDIISQKCKNINKSKKSNKPASSAHDALKNLNDLSFKTVATRPVIDEELKYELDEESGKDKVQNLNGTLNNIASSKSSSKSVTTNNLSSRTECIDPNKLAAVRLKQNATGFSHVNEAMGDIDMDEEDENPAAEQQMTIAEAFEDDDIIADFSKDKAQDSELKNAEIQLAMPGWGSWAGAGISKEKIERRNKRLMLKLAPQEKRKDENKDNVYINEDVSKKLRMHLVSDVPFPFTSLKDYEASIRTPIGRNFVTETAFRMLTRPSVITQKGKIIEPMDESELVKPPRKLRNPVDIRISKMAGAK